MALGPRVAVGIQQGEASKVLNPPNTGEDPSCPPQGALLTPADPCLQGPTPAPSETSPCSGAGTWWLF